MSIYNDNKASKFLLCSICNNVFISSELIPVSVPSSNNDPDQYEELNFDTIYHCPNGCVNGYNSKNKAFYYSELFEVNYYFGPLIKYLNSKGYIVDNIVANEIFDCHFNVTILFNNRCEKLKRMFDFILDENNKKKLFSFNVLDKDIKRYSQYKNLCFYAREKTLENVSNRMDIELISNRIKTINNIYDFMKYVIESIE